MDEEKIHHRKKFDVVVIGAGAAGLMCAATAGARGKKVLLVDHAKSVGEKIRISGGGRCNFTNLYTSPKNFISNNPHFCVSALKRFTPQDFIALVKKHQISFHEKTLGQLFCDSSSRQIVEMLLKECADGNVEILLENRVNRIRRMGNFFEMNIGDERVEATSLVIATGGLSIPKMGASSFGYDVARQFGLKIIEPKPALVPLTFDEEILRTSHKSRCDAADGAVLSSTEAERTTSYLSICAQKNSASSPFAVRDLGLVLAETKGLSGVAVDASVTYQGTNFLEAILFTHRGLSGPAILQISSYLKNGEKFLINLAPEIDVFQKLLEEKKSKPRQELQNFLATFLPKSLANYLAQKSGHQGNIADISNKKLREIADSVNSWIVCPSGTEGFAKAEVTIGGIDTDEISSKTFAAKSVPNLFFIGEVLDVTGWLGGFNFQWAWASGKAAGESV